MRSLKRQDKAPLGALALGLIALAVIAINSGWLIDQFRPSGRALSARFADTGQLKANDPVRVAGVTIGRVDDIELDSEARSATVKMVVEDRAYPIYADARASIRWRTLLGGNFAIELDPGSRGAGAVGSRTIPLARTSNQVEIEDVIGFARSDAKRGIRRLLRELPDVFRDPEIPRRAFSQVRRSSPGLARAISAIRGRRERDLAPIVEATARTVRALDTPTDDLSAVVQGAATTLDTTARRETDLRATLELGGGIQPNVQATLRQLSTTLDIAEPRVNRLRRPAAGVGLTVAKLEPTVVRADALLREAAPLLRNLRPAVRSLATASRSGRRLIADIEPGLGRIANRTLPDLAKPDPLTKLKTYEMIGPTLASLDASASTFDARGHLFRFPALGGQRAPATLLPCSAWFGDPTSDQLLQCQSLSDALRDYANYDPLPPRTNP